MITIYFGGVGSGKSTLAAKIIQREYKKMKKGKSKYKYIVSNVNIKNAIYIENIHEVLSKYAIENALIVIDEAGITYNNRIMRMTENEIRFFKLHRHFHCDIVIISQSFEDVDITIRRLYNKMYMIKNLIFHISMIREIRRYITIPEDEDEIVEGYEFVGLPKFLYRRKYYKYFDSYSRPEDMRILDLSKFPLPRS